MEENKENKEGKKSKKITERKVPVIYMGPTVGNVLCQYTVFTDGVPKAMEELMEDCPAVRNLFVEVAKINGFEVEMKEDGSIQSVYYKKVREYLKRHIEKP